ncbi:MAG: SDR family NAD(P)-dependent oxidoreductase [Acidimicrobiales bacterium]
MELRGKRVLVTGASRGIGRSLATAFARAGANVALVARDGAALGVLAEELGGTAHPADLLDHEQLGHLIHRVEDEAGAIDVLVNNAGLAVEGTLWDHADGDVDAQVRLNLIAPLELCRQAIPRMLRRGGGHLVNVASLAALASVPGMTTYAATKAGLAHGAAALRDELKGLPIGVTTVMVGGVPTELLAAGESYPPFHNSFQRLRRIQLVPDTDPDDLAAAVVRGVERGKRTVYLPRRALPFVAAVEAPRKIVHLALTGVKRRT